MKSTRRWFYLTGSLTVLVLGLMGVLWAMTVAAAPSGATALTEGDVSTDMAVVGPTLMDADDRTVKVTLTNPALSVVQYVGTGPSQEASSLDLNGDGDKDDDDVILVTVDGATIVDGDSFRLRLQDGVAFGADLTLANINADAVLPIVDRNGDGSITVADVEIADDGDGGATKDSADLRITEILDVQTGLLRFVATEDLADGSTFGLRLATSPQETALVNIRGDNGSFDLLTVESVTGPSGAYSATFVADDDVIIAMGDIMHEQHDVPSGLRGNVEIENETISVPGTYTRGQEFTVKVRKAPIRAEDGVTGMIVPVPVGDIDVDGPADFATATTEISDEDARMGVLTLEASRDLDEDDEIQVSYRGSDNFTIAVDYAPVQADITDFVVPSNRDTGASFDDYFAIVGQDTDDGTVTIGVIVGGGDRDSDLNEGLPGHITVLGVSYAGSERIEVTEDVAAGAGYTVALDARPEDANGGGIDGSDIMFVDSSNNAVNNPTFTVDGSSLTINAGVALNEGDTIDVAYSVWVGMNPRNALLPDEADRPIIQVSRGSRVTITSEDDRTTVDAEADAPTFDNPSPAGGSATMDLEQVISIDITDALAGVDTDTIRFLVTGAADPQMAGARTFGDDKGEDITLASDGDVVTASVALDDLTDATNVTIDEDGTTTIHWWVTAVDKAGNDGTSDSDTSDDAEGNQGYSLRVDNEAPTLEGAFVGDRWDANHQADDDDAKGAVVGDRRLRAGAYLQGSSSAKMIRVEFSEDLDGGSVDASDFEVMDGSTELAIASASWFDKNNDDMRGGAPGVKNSVFIELEEALGAGVTPSVKLVGTITDAAGNEVASATIDADDVVDGIAPTATVTLDATASKDKIAVTVTTDENIRTLEPTLELYTSTSANAEDAVAQMANVSIPRAARTAGENEWTFNLNIGAANRYSVVVTAEDSARNRSTAGKADWTDSGSISFEIDDTLTVNDTLTTLPAHEAEATQADPFFVEINWLSEAGEYTGDSHKSVSLTKAVLDAGKDNERDLIDFISTRDGQRWTVAIADIGQGDHTLTYNAEDDLGNTLSEDRTLSFTVVARPVFNLDLHPGLNLISLPGDPTNNDINAVFGEHPAVDLVYTRSGELWLVAQRSADTGMFEPTGGVSDLTTIDAQHAYFVRATASARVGIDISYRGALQVPPSIQVKGNQWNLVPVISLLPLETIPTGSALDADNYLGADWARGFTFDRGRWIGVVRNADMVHQCYNPEQDPMTEGDCGTQDPDNAGEYFTEGKGGQTDDVVEIGRGYWVWFTKDATITP